MPVPSPALYPDFRPPHKINVRWEVFAGVGIMAMTVAFLTVAGQSIRAATMNPVKSLKSE